MDGLSLSSNNSSEGAGLTSTINRVDEMIAAGLILPMRFPDPGKPEGIRTFRKPILTMKVRDRTRLGHTGRRASQPPPLNVSPSPRSSYPSTTAPSPRSFIPST